MPPPFVRLIKGNKTEKKSGEGMKKVNRGLAESGHLCYTVSIRR